MNTNQIETALTSDPLSRKQFCGVFPSDQLPEVMEFPCGFIANTDPHDKSGTHWVVFYFSSEHKGEFFDSYGRKPDGYHETFKDYLDIHSREWSYNDKQLQGLMTNVCGPYCIYYISQRAGRHSMSTIVNLFDSNKSSNDTKVLTFVKKHFYISPKVPSKNIDQYSKKFVILY